MDRAWLTGIGIGAICIGLCAPPMGVEAERPAEQLGLARIIVSEAGWNRTDDGPAILEVLRDRSRRMDITLLGAMRAYSRRTFSKARTDARRWIADLQWHAERPEGWPNNVRWEGLRKEQWLDILDFAGELLESDEPHCGAEHWGAPSFDRPVRLGWRRVDCGSTKNIFWAVP